MAVGGSTIAALSVAMVLALWSWLSASSARRRKRAAAGNLHKLRDIQFDEQSICALRRVHLFDHCVGALVETETGGIMFVADPDNAGNYAISDFDKDYLLEPVVIPGGRAGRVDFAVINDRRCAGLDLANCGLVAPDAGAWMAQALAVESPPAFLDIERTSLTWPALELMCGAMPTENRRGRSAA